MDSLTTLPESGDMGAAKNFPVNSVLRTRLAELEELQKSLTSQPYSIILRLRLAKAYKFLGYPDLAVGDAYKALLLIDEVAEESEYHEVALEAAQADITYTREHKTAVLSPSSHVWEHSECCCVSVLQHDSASTIIDDNEVVNWAKTCWLKTAYDILVGGLIDCGCLRSAFDYNTRAIRAFPNMPSFEAYRETLVTKLQAHFQSTGEIFEQVDISDYPDKGLVRRELYPWNEYEPDRFSPESIQFLNDEMTKVAPLLEVRVANLPLLALKDKTSSPDQQVQHVKQLGVFAKQDIPAGQQVLEEKSLLTAISRLHDSYCDACVAPLPKSTGSEAEDPGAGITIACEDCDEVFFCSEGCHDLAQTQYHAAICGVSLEQKVPATEAADHLYSLLLIRALALAEAQEVHPLMLKEVRYIWGDYHDYLGVDLDRTWKVDARGQLVDPFASVPHTLPFSFSNNILTPLNILEKMDVNIFEQSHRYDTWIFNTLYGKIRGTASARQGLEYRPEIAAVHPMWCLANHSCDPSVSWDWQGSIRFQTREKLVNWKGRDPSVQPGLRKGEEVFSHYCDIRLPVKERREWAVGALGGDCMCSRCIWEEAEEKRQKGNVE
ncbi:hypothetical protein K504DRAFT_406888 [Pleomassaria siparia CBS 279.74]|uniref:Uncharacterized protein n=1 Tax=Pleomassaria siparia CBS 279.74 TaxID=1314801 RepID=A0A6G1KAK6_9PLEO|nr:hypothetical protein K504DRAFT_406888 [Pleomassaria siparia CBS 279.74]